MSFTLKTTCTGLEAKRKPEACAQKSSYNNAGKPIVNEPVDYPIPRDERLDLGLDCSSPGDERPGVGLHRTDGSGWKPESHANCTQAEERLGVGVHRIHGPGRLPENHGSPTPGDQGLGVGSHRIRGPGWQPEDDDDSHADTIIYSLGNDISPRDEESRVDQEADSSTTVIPAFTVLDRRQGIDFHADAMVRTHLHRMITEAPLVPSRVITDNPTQAKPSDQKWCGGFYKFDYRHLRARAIAFVVGVAIIVLVAIFFSQNNSKSTHDSEPEPQPNDYKPAPMSERFVVIRDSLSNISKPDSLTDEASPQFQAVRWLADEDEANATLSDMNRLVQRYIIALFYFSTGGVGWTNQVQFLSGIHECKWHKILCDNTADDGCTLQKDYVGIFCNEANEVFGLGFWHNNLTGSLPHEIFSLHKMELVALSENDLTGTLPDSLGDTVRDLLYFDIHNNFMSGTLPMTLHSLEQLFGFFLWTNFFSGTIPSLPWQVRELVLYNNALSGSLPSSLGNLTYARHISFGKNNLTETMPESIGRLSELQLFDVAENHLIGTIPTSFGGIDTLNALSLGHNNFNGTIPSSLFKLPKLQGIGLDANSLSGTIPPIQSENLKGISVHSNQLTGIIPPSIGNSTRLEVLELGNNQLTGNAPDTMKNLVNLKWLSLRRNSLMGNISFLCPISTISTFYADCELPDPEITCECCQCCNDEDDKCGIYIDIVTLTWDCYFSDDPYCDYV